jgi:hypothetical protein
MKNISISQFKKMKAGEIKDTGSFNLVADGEFVAIVVIPASAFKKQQIQNIAESGNFALGK